MANSGVDVVGCLGCVGLWPRGASGREHLHFVVQPVPAEVIARYGGIRGE